MWLQYKHREGPEVFTTVAKRSRRAEKNSYRDIHMYGKNVIVNKLERLNNGREGEDGKRRMIHDR